MYITDTSPGTQPTINGTMATTPDGSPRPGVAEARKHGGGTPIWYTALVDGICYRAPVGLI